VSATITIEPTDFSFAGYSLVATAYNSLDLDKVDVKNDYSGSAEINPTLSGTIKGPLDLKAGIDHSTEHSYTITDVAPKPYIDLQPCKLTLTEGSEPNQDLTGSTIVKLTLVANSFTSAAATPTTRCRDTQNDVVYHFISSSQNFFKDGKPLPPSKAALTAANVQYNRGTLHAKVKMDYEYRYVSWGASTPIEDDDRAKYSRGTVFASNDGRQSSPDGHVAVVDGGDPGGALWALCTGPSTLAAKQADGQSGTLLFDDLTKATEMVSWLAIRKSWMLGTTSLSVSGRGQPSPFPTFIPCRDFN
jgi:hypothetical protein